MKKKFYLLISLIFIGLVYSQNKNDTLITNKIHFILTGEENIKIDSVIITGNSQTKEYIIRQELTFEPGSMITNEIIEYNKNRIYSLGLFTKIESFLYSISDKNYLEIKVNERWFIFPYPVFGIKDRDWEKLYYGLGIAHQNFLGRNEKIFASFALGYDPWVNLHYFNPQLKRGSGFMLDANLNYSKVKNKSKLFLDQNNDFYEIWYGANLSLGKRFDPYRNLWLTLGYNNLTVDNKYTARTISKDGIDRFITIQIGAQLDTRDLREYPMKGEYISAGISKMGLGESVVDYSRINMDIQKYYPIVLNASFCFRTFAVANFGPIIPFYAHQYYGYGERIRGYFYEIMEGENIWGFSTEIRVPILGPKYYVIEDFPIPEFSILRYALCFNIFYDAGEVWNRKDFMFNKIKSGFGFGLNFLLPYSVVLRAEYGFNQKLKGEFIFDAGVSF